MWAAPLRGRGSSAVEKALGVDGFLLASRTVHRPEQVGEMGRVGGRLLRDWGTGSLGCLHLGVEGAVLDEGTDVEPADVDAFLGYLGVQRLKVVALGGLGEAGAAHVWRALHGAGSLCGQDGAVALLDHVWQEFLDECEQRVDGEVRGMKFWACCGVRLAAGTKPPSPPAGA